ncbi:MAG: HIT domain-containing protein [Planctomycetota bacterium]
MPSTPDNTRSAQANTQPGGPEALEAPWRLEYLIQAGEAEKAGGAAPGASKPGGSFLEHYWQTPELDVEHHVLVRTGSGMVLLNAYPYSNGHLLCALGEPRPRLLDYNSGQRAALWELVELGTELCERTLECQGVNIGVNQGRAAGAGVPSHLHVHIVPRWGGDTNFMTVVGQVRVSPSSLEKMAERYRAVLERVRASL